MKLTKFAAALAIGAGLLLSPTAFAADKETAPAKAAPAKADSGKAEAESAAVKLTKPWSDLNSLTDDQRAKINAIHKKAVAEKNVIEKKEKDDIMALLSDPQKAELKEQAAKRKKETAAKAGDKQDKAGAK